MRKPHVLIILDGFGHREASDSNAIKAAHTPHWNRILAENPHGLISGSGMDVGLPDGQMGNSEVGHMNLGAGRVVYQDFTRITKAIRDGDFLPIPSSRRRWTRPSPPARRCMYWACCPKAGCIPTRSTCTPW